MKNIKLFYLFCFSFLVSSILVGQTNIYVAPNGNDSNSGTIGSPLKTLIGARDKVRSIKSSSGLPSGGIVVNFRGGTYPVTSTCFMNADDAGTSSSPIVYRGYQNEKVIFDGNTFVDNSAFQPTTSAQASKLHSSAVGNVYYQTITDANIINALQSDEAQMSMNNMMMTISRFPNLGFSHIDQSTLTAGYETNNTTGTFSDPKGARFKLIEGIDASKWASEITRTQRVTTNGYLSAQWHKEAIYVVSGTGGYLRLKDGSRYGVDRLKNMNQPNRIFIDQILCELNEPGEWYFDKTDNTLYVWPLEPINSSSKIGVWVGPMMVRINNSAHIHFTHMTIQNLGVGVNGDAAIDLRSGNNYFIAGVTFRNITNMTAFNTWHDVTNTEIRSCDFIDIPGSSRLYGGSFNSTGNIVKGNNKIENCHFTQVYSKGYYGKATHIGGVNNVFKHNLIHNANGQPLTHAGIDHYIALNEIFNVGIEEGDGGAIYTGNDIMSYGNVIRHNFVHHIMDIPGIYNRSSFFSDDFDGGELVEQNVLFKGGGEAIKFNRGAGHSVYKNVIMECGLGVKQSNGGSTQYNICMEYINSTNGKSPTSADKVNYIGRMLQKIGTPGWQNGLNETNWNSRIEQFWRDRYPFFSYSMNSYASNNKMDPYQCRFYDNFFYGNTHGNESSGGAAVLRNVNVTLSMFENPNNLNFKFNSSKPATAPDIPFESIGLYIDSYRCAVPDKDAYRSAIKQRFVNQASRTNDSYNPATINSRLYYNTGKLVYDLIPCTGVTSPATQGPYQGTPQTIPGTIEAEKYDVGGQDLAYNDNDATNNGGAYRPGEGVDIAAHDGGYVVGWINGGEWCEYTVNATAGTYKLEARVASPYSGKRIFVIIDGTTHTVNVPNTTNWSQYQTVSLTGIPVSAGNNKVIRITFPDGGLNLNWIKFTTESTGGNQTPYGGSVWAIPGTVEAENFDNGGENIAYHETTTANQGNQYRTTEGVDIETCNEGGYNVGWIATNEWLEYTVNLANSGTFNLEVRVASPNNSGKLRVEFNNSDRTGTMSVPNTTDYQAWQTISKEITLSAGEQVMKVHIESGSFNINWIKVSNATAPSVNLTLGNGSTTDATRDGWKSNMVINETDTYTNTSGGQEQITVDKFNFYAWQKADPVTPFVVKVNGDNNFTVLAIGTTRASTAYNVGSNSVDFKSGGASITINNNDKIAVGFLDANANGTGSGTGSVIPFDQTSPDQIWYTGGPGSIAGSLSTGNAPTQGPNTLTNLLRNYHFNIQMSGSALKSANGSSQLTLGSEVMLYPNPTNSVLYVNLTGEIQSGTMLHIYDAAGNRVRSLHITSELEEVDVRDFPNGMYLMQVINGTSISTHKFIKE